MRWRSIPAAAPFLALSASAAANPSWPVHTMDEGTTALSDSARRSDERRTTLDRPFLYLVAPALPAPMHIVFSYSAGYASTEAASRPLAATAGRGGLVNELRLEAGILDRLAPFAVGRLAPPVVGDAHGRGAFELGGRVLLSAPDDHAFRLAVDLGFGRDFSETSLGIARVVSTFDVGRLRLGTMVQAEKAAAVGRDPVDLYAVAGGSIRVVDRLRVGAEYVAQDVEELGDGLDAEGGMRQFASASIAWSNDRVFVGAGPALGLGGGAPKILGRAQIGTMF